MASYHKNSFTISLADYAANQGKGPSDFDISTIIVSHALRSSAISDFNEQAKDLDAVVALQEGLFDLPAEYASFIDNSHGCFIRGTGVKLKRNE